MKLMTLSLILCVLDSISAGPLLPVVPKSTDVVTSTDTYTQITTYPDLAKREPRKVVVNKEWLKQQAANRKKQAIQHGEEVEDEDEDDGVPPPWIRTIYDSIVEVVTPTVIAGVTFSTRPATTTEGTEWWISVKDDGSPKTIKPKLKNGQIKHGYPDVGTYFQTATTIVHKQEELKAHNLKQGDVMKEVVMIPEDDTYVQLSPLMRCTPDFYFKRGLGNMEESEPFCRPKDGRSLRVGKTYFLTWYSRFYNEAKNVRFHYAYVKEKLGDKGMVKRDGMARSPVKEVGDKVAELSSTGNKHFHGEVAGSFYTSPWVLNDQGFIPIEVKKPWLHGHIYRQVLVAIQPDTISDDDFEILEAPHLILRFQLKESIGKNTKEMRHKMDMPGSSDDIYYVIMLIPTLVIVALFCMYVFVEMNRKHRDLSHLRLPRRSRYGNMGKYSTRYAETDFHKPGTLKQQ